MSFESPYFENVEDALGAAQRLVLEDRDYAFDRSVVAKFYNGREVMSPEEAEKENHKTIVNHLFGYSALDQLRQQLTAVYSADDIIWKVHCSLPDINVADKQALESNLTNSLNYRIKRSKRLKPEIRALCGNLVLHGRDCLVFMDRFDWCPKSSFLYVPSDTSTSPEEFTYGFHADKMPYYQLKSYLKKSEQAGSTGWNKEALKEALEALKESCGVKAAVTLDGEEQESENRNQENSTFHNRRESSMTMPVWYLFEVDQDKASKPVTLTIIARYTYADQSDNKSEEVTRDKVLYHKEAHFASVHHWLKPFFIDTEIGGAPTWHSVMGIGKLNYPGDADVEEFFNMAMDGAKDAMRTKYTMADGASREKAMRFFQDRGDLLPEGLVPVQQQANNNYQHGLAIVNTLQILSKEKAGAPTSNTGTSNDELEVQAQERQSKASALIASRMTDVYDMSDEVGLEIFRRFTVGVNSESSPGYVDIKAYREDLERLGITSAMREKLCESSDGLLKYISVKTSRAAGDGSPTREMMVNDRLMSEIGLFAPAAQEIIKRRRVLSLTRDPQFAKDVVPYEQKPDPDQLARARTENTAAIERGITGFSPDLNADDVGQIHLPEHDNALDALIAKATQAGSMDPFVAAGFKSLATHQAKTAKALEGAKPTAEAANAAMQKLQEQTRQAEGLIKAYETNQQQNQLTAKEQMQAEQFAVQQDFKERQQASVEQDRAERREDDKRAAAVNEVKAVNEVATKQAQTIQPVPA